MKKFLLLTALLFLVFSQGVASVSGLDFLQYARPLVDYLGPGKINYDVYSLPNGCINIVSSVIINIDKETVCPDAKGVIHVNETAFNAILYSNDPELEVKKQFKENNISYEPLNLIEAIRAIFIGLFKGFI